MNKKTILAIMKKDWKAIFSSAQMWVPMIVVPIVFIVVIPLAVLLSFKSADFGTMSKNIEYSRKMLEAIPQGALRNEVLSFSNINQQVGYVMLNFLFTPLFLLLPVMASSIIAANSFAGEKEKKTLESLLFSPVSERELMFSKVMASFIPAVVITFLSAVFYGIIVDTVGYGFFGKMIFPSFNWIITVFWLSPAISLLSVFITVFISAKVKGFQEAEQLSVIVILPILALFISQIAGVLFLGNFVEFLIGLALFLLDAVLLKYSSKSFNRQKLFMSQI